MPPLKFTTATAIGEAVRDARSDCRDALRKDPDTRRLWIVSRGAWVRTVGLNCDATNEDGAWEFKPTLQCLRRMAALRDDPQCGGVYIEGGFNAAETGQDYAAGSYDPWVGEWSVAVWTRD